MNRYVFITGFIILAILTNSIEFGHISVSAVQESTLADHHAFDAMQPGDEHDYGKNKSFFYDSQVLLVFLILCLAIACNRNSVFLRRQIFLTPVFYQSNYVDNNLLNN
ncbi:hypothetical protein [Bacillus sp. AK031]